MCDLSLPAFAFCTDCWVSSSCRLLTLAHWWHLEYAAMLASDGDPYCVSFGIDHEQQTARVTQLSTDSLSGVVLSLVSENLTCGMLAVTPPLTCLPQSFADACIHSRMYSQSERSCQIKAELREVSESLFGNQKGCTRLVRVTCLVYVA